MEIRPITSLYRILHGPRLPWAGAVLDSPLANWVRLMDGLSEGRSVHLSRIASHLRARATNGRGVAPLNGFLGNSQVEVRTVYEAIARELLKQAAKVGRIMLIMESPQVGFSAQVVRVCLAYQGRALPLIWTW